MWRSFPSRGALDPQPLCHSLAMTCHLPLWMGLPLSGPCFSHMYRCQSLTTQEALRLQTNAYTLFGAHWTSWIYTFMYFAKFGIFPTLLFLQLFVFFCWSLSHLLSGVTSQRNLICCSFCQSFLFWLNWLPSIWNLKLDNFHLIYKCFFHYLYHWLLRISFNSFQWCTSLFVDIFL